MTTMRVVGECFFWYRLTRVFPDKFHRAVKRFCVCVYGNKTYYVNHWWLIGFNNFMHKHTDTTLFIVTTKDKLVLMVINLAFIAANNYHQ